MANADNNLAVTTEVKVLDARNVVGDKKTSKVVVMCQTGSAVSALVRIPGLHNAGEQYRIEAGEKQEFQLGDYGISEMFLAGDGGTATVSFASVGANLKA